jgi:hypothetical protein
VSAPCQAFIHTFDAKIAFHDCSYLEGIDQVSQQFEFGFSLSGEILRFLFLLIEIGPLLIWASDGTSAAAHAFVVVNQDNAILPFVRGSSGACLNAGGFGAMIAQYWINQFAAGRIGAPFPDENPIPKDLGRQKMFLLARNRTGPTSYTTFHIDDHSPFCHNTPLLFRIGSFLTTVKIH